MAGRVLAIGDVHGCSRAMIALLDAVRPDRNDLVITLGDYVSRGLDSAGVIERLLALRDQSQLIALRGNHEEMMLDARRDKSALRFWLNCGGEAALISYAPESDVPLIRNVPEAHWHFLERDCRDWYETDTHIFVHAGVVADLTMDLQPANILRWQALEQARPHVSGKVVICGHTPQKDGLPRNLGHTICLDTGAGSDGPVTCLEVSSGRLWQATERGDVVPSSLPPAHR